MPKELTDKVKLEIVEAQINYIKNKDPSNFFNYRVLKDCLINGIKDYLKLPLIKEEILNEEVDNNLMKELAGRILTTRLINLTRAHCGVLRNDYPKNKDFMNLYENAEKSFRVNKSFSMSNYGKRSHAFIKDYLNKKKLI